jgi:flagellar biosynthesis anti-sigma factor FlgM
VRITNHEARFYPAPSDTTVQNSSVVSRSAANRKPTGASNATAYRVELSSGVQDVQRALAVVRATPDIRTARVAEAQQALAQQTLPLRGEELADKVLTRALRIR